MNTNACRHIAITYRNGFDPRKKQNWIPVGTNYVVYV